MRDLRTAAARRYTVPNDDGVACDACGSAEPRWLHLLKDEATERYALVGSNCVRALTDLGTVRRRYATDPAEQAYANELAHRQAGQSPQLAEHDSEPLAQADAPTMPAPAAAREGARLVAAVAVLREQEWATLVETLPLGAERWRFIALDGSASGLAGLVVLGINGTADAPRS